MVKNKDVPNSQDISGIHIQSNLNGSNTDGSFTMANSNSFLSPYKIFPIALNKTNI